MIYTGNDSSQESGEEEEEGEQEVEVRGEMVGMVEGVTSLTDALHSMTLHSPVCHPDRPNKVYIICQASMFHLAI